VNKWAPGNQIRLRLVLFCGFFLVSLIPVSIIDFWVQRYALNNEYNAVQEKHLLVAQNLTNALSRYSIDVAAAFSALADDPTIATGNQIQDILSTLHFKSIHRVNRGTGLSIQLFGINSNPPDVDEILDGTRTEDNYDRTIFGSLIFDKQEKPAIPLFRQIAHNEIMVGELDPKYIIELQQAISFGNRGHAAIVDHTGQVIAHPNKDWQMNKKNIGVVAPVKQMMAGKTGVSTFYSPAMKADMIAGYSFVPETGWGAMIPQPIAELEERVKEFRYISNSIMAVSILLAVIFSFVLALWLSRPLRALADAARSITSGNPVKPVTSLPSLTPSEVTDVADAFNVMIHTISIKQTEISANTAILQATINNMAEGVVLIDNHRNVQLHNEKFLSLLNIEISTLNSHDLVTTLTKIGHPQKDISNLSELLNSQLKNEFARTSMTEFFTVDDQTLEFRCGVLPDKCIVLTCIDVTERKHAERKVQYLATHDSLTHLLNRHAFDEKLDDLIKFHTHNVTIPLIYLDLDLFKEVNDSLGHGFGDQLLIEVAVRLSRLCGEEELVARFGGDEFALLLQPNSDAHYASIIARKIIEVLAQPFTIDKHEVFIQSSLGIVLFPEHGDSPKELLKKVDLAMYAAKSTRRGSFKFYSPDMEIALNSRKENEYKLRQGLINKEFVIHYQPILNTQTNIVVGAEALIRWQRDKKLLLPAEFIPFAEKIGLIAPISEWCLQTVISQIKEVQSRQTIAVPISVNLSATQFKKVGLSALVFKLLDEYEVDPALLVVEITENVAIANEKIVLKELTSLSSKGILIAMDDFGTGYSSLSHLKSFPVNFVKIDKSFTWSIGSNRDETLIVTAIIQLCEHLQLTPIAEGVETIEQLEFLKQAGCYYIQGFYFHPALPFVEYESLLEKRT